MNFNVNADLLTPPPLSDFENAARNNPSMAVASGQRIDDETTGVSFNLPSEGWARAEEDIRELAQFLRQRFKSPDGVQDLRFLEIPFEFDANKMPRRLESFIRRGAKDVEKKLQKQFEVAGRRAIRVDLQGTVPGEKTVSRISVIAIESGSSTLLYLYRAKPDKWQQYQTGLEGMLATVAFRTAALTESFQNGRRVEAEDLVFSIVEPKGWTTAKAKAGDAVILKMTDGQGAKLIATFTKAKKVNSPVLNVVDPAMKKLGQDQELIGTRFQDFSGYDGQITDFETTIKGQRQRVRLLTLKFENQTKLTLRMHCKANKSGAYRQLFLNLTDALEILNPEAELPKIENKAKDKAKVKPKAAVKKRPKAKLY